MLSEINDKKNFFYKLKKIIKHKWSYFKLDNWVNISFNVLEKIYFLSKARKIEILVF